MGVRRASGDEASRIRIVGMTARMQLDPSNFLPILISHILVDDHQIARLARVPVLAVPLWNRNPKLPQEAGQRARCLHLGMDSLLESRAVVAVVITVYSLTTSTHEGFVPVIEGAASPREGDPANP